MALSPSDRSITNPDGANRNLWNAANKHDDQPTLGPRANKVQAGALSLINATSPIGPANSANPLGTGISPGGSNDRSE